MTANGIKVLEALSRAPDQWFTGAEIAALAGISPRGTGPVMNHLYFHDEVLRRSYNIHVRAYEYQINDKGLEIANASVT